jgi:phosphoserine aminotransferase
MASAIATERVFNFSSGPAALPLPVLQEAQRDLVCLPGFGMSVLEMSHRSDGFLEILATCKRLLKELLAIPDNYKIVFLQGGSRLQFSMIPLNLMRGQSNTPDYIVSGSWSKFALDEAKREGQVNIAWDGKPTNFDRLPKQNELKLNSQAAYVYACSNETIQGVQFSSEIDTGNVPLVCDASSDFLHRPLPIERYGLIYACAQKNAGPAGVTAVIIRDDLVNRSSDQLHGYLSYKNHVKEDSLYNTPPTFAI